MAENLLIVESPSKAKTLKKYLGDSFEILASYGHVRDLVPKTGAVDPTQDFAMQYELIERNQKHVDAIAKAVKNADHIFLATDPDREGEAIAWHLAEILKSKRLLKDKTMQRVVFYEITQSAVREAVANPREILQPLVNAQQARRALDYLVGFNISPLLWKARRGLSAGRVQSPALRMICEREREIEAFESREYWSVHLDGVKANQGFKARLTLLDGEKVEQFAMSSRAGNLDVVRQLAQAAGGVLRDAPAPTAVDADGNLASPLAPEALGGTVRVVKVERKRKQRTSAAPFTTSTLQQEAVRKLGFTTDRTMKVAQQLYEGIDVGGGAVGLISYMRTDSVALSKEAIADIRLWVKDNFNSEYLPANPVVFANKSKNAQEAHEAIRPTSIARTPASLRDRLNPEQLRLYEMIWKRTVASQMAPARFDTVSVDLATAGNPGHQFRATGQTLVFAGFIAVYQEGRDDHGDSDDGEARLPAFEEGDVVDVARIFGEQHFTQPPPRYTEASLVKALEEHGIGRPSTYASIVSTLQTREYVTLDSKRFKPTDVGLFVNAYLTERFARYVDYDFTAQLENQLDVISEGNAAWIPVLHEFWDQFSESLRKAGETGPWPVMPGACPKCEKSLSLHLGFRGLFVGCDGYPECDYTQNLHGEEEQRGPITVGLYPDSGQPILLLSGPYGPYVQVGETVKDSKEKPRRASVPKELAPGDVTVELALKLLSLPRDLGLHPDSGKKVSVNIGRFGPYIQHDGEFRSVPKADDVYAIDLPRALEVLAQPKGLPRGALRLVGKHPADNATITLHAGSYGHYVKHGKTNATLPKDADIDALSLEDAVALLAERAAKDGSTARTGARKAPATKKATDARATAARSTATRTTAAKAAKGAPPKAAGKAAASASGKVVAGGTTKSAATAKATAVKKPPANKKPAAKAAIGG